MKLIEQYGDDPFRGYLVVDNVFDDLEKMKQYILNLNKVGNGHMIPEGSGRVRLGMSIPEFAKYADYTCDKINSFLKKELRASHGQYLFQYLPGSRLTMHRDDAGNGSVLTLSTTMFGESTFYLEADEKEFKIVLSPNQGILFSPRYYKHGKEAGNDFSCTHLYHFVAKDDPFKVIRE